MARLAPLLIGLLSALGAPDALAQEHFFRFVERDRGKINSTLTQLISIDAVVGDTVYAYANPAEMQALLALGYTVEPLARWDAPAKTIVMAATPSEMAGWDRYPTYEVYRAMMRQLAQDHPTLARLDSIGPTVQGRQLYVLTISANAHVQEPEPEVLLTSTMHGDENTGFVLLLRMAHYLLAGYHSVDRITRLLNSTAIHINPNANPDGSYRQGNHTVFGSTRSNANGVDLNRNFPDPRLGLNPRGPHQPETVAMMNFAATRRFTLSANLHDGAEVVNFPWDTWVSTARRHADHGWFYHLSRQYATLAQANSPPGYLTDLDHGVTHGGDWYVIAGGRQDYMNYWHACREVTLEISTVKTPPSADLPALWDYNREALLTFMERATLGIQGVVRNPQGDPLPATITVLGHDSLNSQVQSSAATGFYARMIAPGTWTVEYSAPGHQSLTLPITVSGWDSRVVQDVTLAPLPPPLTASAVDAVGFALRVWPNPAHQALHIHFSLPQAARTRVELVDPLRPQPRALFEGHLAPGHHTLEWPLEQLGGLGLGKGVHVVRVITPSHKASQKVIIAPP